MVKPPLRTKSIGFKVSEEEYALLETAARASGRTLGEWCREAILRGGSASDSINAYTWDAEGKPIAIGSNTYTYDALGRVVEQNSNTQTVYGPTGKLALVNGGTLVKAFVPLPAGAQAVYTSSGLAYYRHSDWLGSSRLATTPSRSKYYDVNYAPYGESYGGSGTTDLDFTGDNQDMFPGSVTGLYDTPNRELRFGQGRWLSPDPAGMAAADPTNPQTWNRYAYVMNNPLALVDPLGLSVNCDSNGNCVVVVSKPLPPPGPCDVGGPGCDSPQAPGGGGGDGPGPTSPPTPQQPTKQVTCRQIATGNVPSGSFSSWYSGASTADNMLSQFESGLGPANRDFGPDSVQSQQMMSSYGLAQNTSNFLVGGASSGNQHFGLTGLFSSGLNPTAQFVGSYHWSMALSGGNLNITITNTTTPWSAFFHLPIFNPNPPTRTGWQPFGRINQTFHIQAPC